MDDPPRLAIELQDLQKSFSGKSVLDGIDLSVPAGQVFGYIGPNGAGKSTTVKILVGTLDGFSGAARVAGFDVRTHPLEVKRRIGYLPENASLYEALTVAEHLRLVGRLHDLQEATIAGRGHALLQAFELDGRSNSRIGALSKGMRQKLMIASALLHDPEILFLDEPLSGLDVHSTVMIKELVRVLAQSGKTVFYCSHMMDVVERVCDRIAVLDRGTIVADGSFAELAGRSQEGGTLERVFMELTGSGAAVERAEAVAAALGGGG